MNFNTLSHALISLKKSSIRLSKIFVFDQASEDGSGKKLQEMYGNDSQVEVVINGKNYGFAVGINIGVQKALDTGADYVFLLNNDTIVDEYCINHLYDVLKSESKAAVAGPAILYYSNPEKLWQAGGYFSKIKMGVKVPDKGKLLSEINHRINSVEFLTGCALLIPRSTFQTIGLFDPSLFFYGDDVDYGLRVKEAGLNMYFVPEAKVWHKIEDITIDRTTPYVLYHLARSTIIILRKRFFGLEKFYGIFLQFTIYTAFRIWQTIKGRRSWNSVWSWLKGLIDGTTAETT